jgi:hypothetical protein
MGMDGDNLLCLLVETTNFLQKTKEIDFMKWQWPIQIHQFEFKIQTLYF